MGIVTMEQSRQKDDGTVRNHIRRTNLFQDHSSAAFL